MRLIHLTDPHLSSLEGLGFMNVRGKRRSGYLSWYRNRRHVHRRDVLERLMQAVAAEDADQVLLTGDLVHIGLEREMEEAAAWLTRLGPPEKVMLIPGNHDNYARDSNAAMYRHWADYLPAEGRSGADYTAGYPISRNLGNLQLIGLNSSCVTRIFSARGELGQEQRNRLSSRLGRDTGDQSFKCLLIHHPPLPGMTKRRKALRDDRQLRHLLEQHAPDLVLYGHIHSNRDHVTDAGRIFCTASASSIRNASYRVIDVEEGEMRWTCRMRLMTLIPGSEPGRTFTVAEETSWSKTL